MRNHVTTANVLFCLAKAPGAAKKNGGHAFWTSLLSDCQHAIAQVTQVMVHRHSQWYGGL